MAERFEIAFEIDGVDEMRGALEEASEHITAALRSMERLQGEHVLTPRVVNRPGERTTSRSAGTSSEEGASTRREA